MGDMGVGSMLIALPSHRCEDIIIEAVFFHRYVNQCRAARLELVEDGQNVIS